MTDILGKFVLVLTFVGALAVVTSLLPPSLSAETSMPEDPSLENLEEQLYNMTAWSPAPYPITNALVDDNLVFVTGLPFPGHEASNEIQFTKAGESHISCWLVRDNFYYGFGGLAPDEGFTQYKDFLYIETQYSGGLWFGHHNRWYVITLDHISENFNDRTNFSRVDFKLRYALSAWFTYDNATYASFDQALYSNAFNMTIGNLATIVVSDANPWGLISQIMTFSLPGTPWIVNILIATPIYAMITFLAISIVSSFIPTIPGLGK